MAGAEGAAIQKAGGRSGVSPAPAPFKKVIAVGDHWALWVRRCYRMLTTMSFGSDMPKRTTAIAVA